MVTCDNKVSAATLDDLQDLDVVAIGGFAWPGSDIPPNAAVLHPIPIHSSTTGVQHGQKPAFKLLTADCRRDLF